MCHVVGSTSVCTCVPCRAQHIIRYTWFCILKGVCQEPAWRIPPMAKVMRKRLDRQRRDQDSRDPLNLLEHLPPNQNLSYYFMPFINSSDINRGLP